VTREEVEVAAVEHGRAPICEALAQMGAASATGVAQALRILKQVAETPAPHRAGWRTVS
jgi:hypothetical protein